MAEILYKYMSKEFIKNKSSIDIKWLGKNELQMFNKHLQLCGQTAIDNTLWDEIHNKGTIYAGVFVDGNMVARACVEKYSDLYWEVGDVRVANSYRGCGYAHEICSFVLNYIVLQNRIPTIRTEADNIIMQKVIKDLAFALF